MAFFNYLNKSAEYDRQTYHKYIDKFYCSMCGHYNSRSYYKTNNSPVKYCLPSARLVISGFAWFKQLCPLDGIHTHLICCSCGSHGIIKRDDLNLEQI